MNDMTKRKMVRILYYDVLKETSEYCKENENSTCHYMTIYRKILECARKFPQFKDVKKEDFLSKQSPVRNVPSEVVYDKTTEVTKQEPILVVVGLEILGISDFDDFKMEFKLEYIITASWNTSAADCNQHIKILCAQGLDFSRRPLRLFSENFDLVWSPDLFIANADSQENIVDGFDTRKKNDVKYIKVTQIPDPSPEDPRLSTFCGMKMVVKGIATISCNMEFINYPGDVQKCNLYIRSFRDNKDLLKLRFQEQERVMVLPKGILLPAHTFAFQTNETSMTVLGSEYLTCSFIGY